MARLDRTALIGALLANVPAAMQERTQWLMWRFEPDGDKPKPLKVPYYRSGGRRKGKQGSDEDRAALCTLQQAVERLRGGQYEGVGFAFLPGDGLVGIDVDHAIDRDTGEVAAHCLEIVERCGSYTELSPSGTGLHVIVAGDLKIDGQDLKTFKDNTVGVEVFCGRQFFTVTGERWGGGDGVADLSRDTVAWLHQLVKGGRGDRGVQASAPASTQPATTAPADNGARRYCLAALDSALTRMRGAGEGKRNDTLNAEAYGLAQLVHTGGISEMMIRVALMDAARACGLGENEINLTMGSGISAGLMAPRYLPERAQQRTAPAPAPRREDPPPVDRDVAAESSPPPSGGEAPAPSRRGEGAEPAPKKKRAKRAASTEEGGDDDEKPAWFWPRVDMLTHRFALIYSSDTAWDSQQQMIVRVPTMRLAFGSDPVKYWLGRVAAGTARTVLPTDLVFEPGQDVPAHQINMFGGLVLEPTPCDAAAVAPMLDLLRHLCSETSTSADDVDAIMHWILCWQAMPLQQLGTKMQTACVFHGAQGTGKNLYWDAWRDLFGAYGITVGQTELEDKFNGWVSRKLAIIGDEVVSRQEMYHNKNRLKLIVTQEHKFPIRGMQQETRWESNHANVVFLSNESQPLALEERDRRYLVVYTPLEAQADLYEAVRAFKAAGGLAKWLHYLQTYPLDGFNAHTKPILTRAKVELIELNWKAPERFAHEWLEGYLELPMRVCSAEQLYRAFRRWCDLQGERWPPSQAIFTRQVDRWTNERRQRDGAGRLEQPKLIYKQIALKDELSVRKTSRCWLPAGTGAPAGISEGEWAHDSVRTFEADLSKFCRRPGMQEDEA